MNLENRIANHPNTKTLIFEMLSENASFLYKIFSEMKIWKSPVEAQKNLRKILEAYLMVQNNLTSQRGSYKDFLEDEETIYSAMDYLYKSFRERNGGLFEVSLIALWIALERREGEFEEFLKIYPKEGPCEVGELLTAFYVFSGNE